jgi:D-arginine dehydrogenase
MAGVSLAAALAPDHRVVVIEAESELGRHATGRSAATYLPSYGGDVVRALTVASRPRFDELSQELGDELLRPLPALFVATDDASEQAVRQTAESTGAMELVDTATAVGLCSALRVDRILGGGVDLGGASIEVAALHQVYIQRVRRHGGTVLASAPLHAVARRTRGWQVTAGEHSLATNVIVDAAGAWVDDVADLAGVPGIVGSPSALGVPHSRAVEIRCGCCELGDGRRRVGPVVLQARRWPAAGFTG